MLREKNKISTKLVPVLFFRKASQRSLFRLVLHNPVGGHFIIGMFIQNMYNLFTIYALKHFDECPLKHLQGLRRCTQ